MNDPVTVAAELFEVDESTLLSPSRRREIIIARNALFLAYREAGWGLKDIARLFKREHTTILYAAKNAAKIKDPEYRYAVAKIAQSVPGVVRGQKVQELRSDVIAQATKEAESIITRARAEARRIIKDAEDRAASRMPPLSEDDIEGIARRQLWGVPLIGGVRSIPVTQGQKRWIVRFEPRLGHGAAGWHLLDMEEC